jgi:ribonuclease HII
LERRLAGDGFRLIAGVDEAGRGPLAGPVVAAAVMLPVGWRLQGLRDSKALSAGARVRLNCAICEAAVALGVGIVEPSEIDRLNVLRATWLAMERALLQLSPRPDVALIDGKNGPELPFPRQFVVRGDSRSASIAAASIIAKVTRDRIMGYLDGAYPGYGFAKHKGYGTAEHRARLRELGPSPIHRRSFSPVIEALSRQLELLG